MDNIKVNHLGEDYATIEIDGIEFEASRGLGLAMKQAIKYDIQNRTWVCKDETCKGKTVRDYGTLAEVGNPYCPKCDCDMVQR